MDWNNLLYGLLDTVIYSVVGIIMMTIGFLVINLFTPFSIKKEIEDDQNISLGVIIGSVIIGISIIIASVITTPTSSSTTKKQDCPRKKLECPHKMSMEHHKGQ